MFSSPVSIKTCSSRDLLEETELIPTLKERFLETSCIKCSSIERNYVRTIISGKTTYLWYVPWQKQEEKSLDIPNMEEETPF